MNYAEEAIGITQAAAEAGMPVAISFTVETDAHPDHFRDVLQKPWVERIRGLRANASRKSHAELNESTELDSGNPAELGAQYARLKQGGLPRLSVVGGCCGTDHRHVESIA